MAEHKWKLRDTVWFWSEKICKWLPNRIVLLDSRGGNGDTLYIVDVCIEHPGGYSGFASDLRPRDPAKEGKDKPTAESEARRE